MPITSNGAARRVARRLEALATPASPAERRFLGIVRAELKPAMRRMYETSSDPFGSSWTRDKDGRPAYQSKKMANAIGIKRAGGGFEVHYWVKWIRAADEGHTFRQRKVSGGNVYFDADGRFLSKRKADRLFGKRTQIVTVGDSARFYRSRLDKTTGSRFSELVGRGKSFADHDVGPRVLPPRRQQPGGVMPDGWGQAINRGADNAMRDFLERSTDGGPE